MSPSCEIVRRIGDVDPAQWRRLEGTGQPFLRHAFFSALEETGCVSAATGWEPIHLLARDARQQLVGAMPLYLKTHSWGEFVFDWAWAEAWSRAGRAYYPKLLCAVPFTPVRGQRILLAPGPRQEAVADCLLDAAAGIAADRGLSSSHVLFPKSDELARLEGAGYLLRKDCRFLWHNRGYESFDDFLGALSSSKRKKMRRERRRVQDAGIRFETLTGGEMTAGLWRKVYAFYATTFLQRGHQPYFPPGLFARLGERVGEQMLVALARRAGEPVAAAVFFHDETCLYGRYWGCSEEWHSLHFEACYYQGIDFCIRRGLRYFDPGTQGEHKLTRGFEPVPTWSAHRIADEEFSRAIASWLRRERQQVDQYIATAREHLPYRKA